MHTRRDGAADALLSTALSHPGRGRIGQQHPQDDTRPRAVGEQPDHLDVLGQEQGRVGEDADLALGAAEQPTPLLTGHGAAGVPTAGGTGGPHELPVE